MIVSFDKFINEDSSSKEDGDAINKKYSSYGAQKPDSEELLKNQYATTEIDDVEYRENQYGKKEHDEKTAEQHILNSIIDKLERSSNILGELEEFLKDYDKINTELLVTAIGQINGFQDVIKNEIKNLD